MILFILNYFYWNTQEIYLYICLEIRLTDCILLRLLLWHPPYFSFLHFFFPYKLFPSNSPTCVLPALRMVVVFYHEHTSNVCSNLENTQFYPFWTFEWIITKQKHFKWHNMVGGWLSIFSCQQRFYSVYVYSNTLNFHTDKNTLFVLLVAIASIY